MQTKYFYTILALVWASALIAQGKRAGKAPASSAAQPAPYWKHTAPAPEHYLPEPENPHPISHPAVSARQEEFAGFTTWDAQSYGSMPSRIYGDANGNPVATWLYGSDLSGGYPERGTGYNVRASGGWPNVNNRLEAIRTGFPAAARLDDGTELVVSHATGFNPFRIHVARKAAGASTWVETDLDNPPGSGCLWPRVAVGGPDGKSVHVIAITSPTGGSTNGVIYQGVDGHLLYWRSTDGGLTWDKKYQIIPGLDSSKVKALAADEYTIDVNGDAVGIAIFPTWNDVLLFKSLDNGDTWEQTVVNDFPDALENYVGADGDFYTFDDIGYFDPEAPDSLAVFTNDGFGSLLIDDALQAHVWFGRMYVIDNDPAANTFYYPGTNGLCYWKESWGSDNIQVITGALDYDGDSLLTLVGGGGAIGPYYNSLSSFATTGMDAEGSIYLVYAAVNELYRSNWGAEKDQYYRHLYIMKSEDNGDTWSEPFELTAPPFVDEAFIGFVESAWPAIQRRIVGDKVWVLYQQDGIPGSNVWGTNHSATTNTINWFEVPTDFLTNSIFDLPQADAAFDLALSPNPATSTTQLSAHLTGDAPAMVEVFDSFGRLAQQYRFPSNGHERQTMTLPVQHLPIGIYAVRVTQGGRFGIVKLLRM
ncbi:MAG: T9SS type A sorting domain-containing protein [Saprospiraceae bacterium]|nr:T9SS type A sorting domain-containing protein [Saprospiraceae bacterium]